MTPKLSVVSFMAYEFWEVTVALCNLFYLPLKCCMKRNSLMSVCGVNNLNAENYEIIPRDICQTDQ